MLHQVVREHLESFLAELAQEGHYLPKHVEQEFRRYVPCGILSEGFARIACRDCGDELLVAFSCKGRAFCPSCCARRMSDTAAHLVDRVLPEEAPYRQWVLSYPFAVRLALARNAKAAAQSCKILVSEIFRFQRRLARAAGCRRPKPGAVSFTQRFGSKLNANLHHHVVVPDGVFEEETGAQLVRVAAPKVEELARVLQRVVRRTRAMLVGRGLLEEPAPDDTLAHLQAQAVQTGMPFAPSRPRSSSRLAVDLDGYSLEAATHVHEQDRLGLEHLCRYGLRAPFAQHRLKALADGRVQLGLRRPAHDGVQAVAFTPHQFLSRLAAIVPPARAHLTRYHGVFANRAKLRPALVPPPKAEQEPGAQAKSPSPLRDRKLPWADLLKRVFGEDLLTCAKCGGRRRVKAILANPQDACEVLQELGIPAKPLRLKQATGPPVQLDLPPPGTLDGIDPVYPGLPGLSGSLD